jgi:hypothetical protein
MDQDHEANAKRRKEPTRTRNAANPPKSEPDQIDPERLRKAIRYFKEHPEQQSRQIRQSTRPRSRA